MKKEKKDKKSYNVFDVIKRMLKHMAEQDKKQYPRIVIYTLLAAIYPFMAVFLPKLAIGIVEQYGENAITPLIIAMVAYFIVAGALAIAVNYFKSLIETRMMRIRLLYLGDLSKKLQNMDYWRFFCLPLKP